MNIRERVERAYIKAAIAERKEAFPPHSLVLVNKTIEDPYSPLHEGLSGVVRWVDDIGQVHALWSNGSTLAAALEDDVSPVMVRGVNIAQFHYNHIRLADRVDNLHYYEVRHDDECQGIACTIEKSVSVSFLGTVVTIQPLPLENGCLDLTDEESKLISSYI